MSITLDLSPELEAHLRADAKANALPVEALAVEKLNGLYLISINNGMWTSVPRAQRLFALSSLGTHDTRTRAGLAPTTERDDDRGTLYDDGHDDEGDDQ